MKSSASSHTKIAAMGRASVVLWMMVILRPVLPAAIKPPPDAMEHWAFQPPQEVSPPQPKKADWAKTDIDRFILAKLEEQGTAPNPPADARTLIRRMYFDLTGLPPSAAEVQEFERATDRTAAVSVLVDRLLASPRYGERWGRYWLDVARYSDTKGYVYAREERRFVHSATYRDWVIRAFNDDLPYDRFLLLQMAGDQLLPEGSPDLAAMGFITGGRRFIGVTHDIIDDRIDVVMRGTMALTVQCARCHDHKYDPIPTADYYSLYGVFHGADDRLVPLGAAGDGELVKRQKALSEAMARRRGEAAQRLRERLADYLAAQLEMEKYPEEGFDQILYEADLIPASVRRWRDFLQTEVSAAHPVFGPWCVLAKLSASGFEAAAAPALAALVSGGKLHPLVAAAFATAPKDMPEAARRYGAIFADALQRPNVAGAGELNDFLASPRSPAIVPDTSIVNNELFFVSDVANELWKLQGEVERRLIELKAPAALVLTERPAEPNPRVFLRGSAARPGEEVPRRLPQVLGRAGREPFREGNGRLELARAIASPANPLTARVMVNRLWQHHFGTGLVRTTSDFGLRAEKPSHPALLDWLAQRFVREGWSVKTMHRLILTSAVYQQASASEVAAPANDPDNRLLSRFPVRRMDFEALRDAMLCVSGELDSATGGKTMDVLDADNRRRTVYAYVDRQFLTGVLRTFDFANPDIHVAVRHETTVPQQALFFLNGDFAAARARKLAKLCAAGPTEQRVQSLYRTLYQRDATRSELDAAVQFLTASEAGQPPAPAAPAPTQWSYGTGEYDDAAKKLKSFTALPHFTGTSWQGAAAFPGGETGWAQLTATGGHPGDTRARGCVRRWVAPAQGVVSVRGVLKHEPEQGDGIRAFIVSSRHSELKAARVHHSQEEMNAPDISVEAGDFLDFIVDIGDTLSYDQFLWEPLIVSGDKHWNAKEEFNGPASAPAYLSPWEQYVQVLLLANEFAFVD